MLTEPPIEKLLPIVNNRYVLTLMTAKRARQLVDGAQPLTKKQAPSVVTTASQELSENAVTALQGKHEITVPLRPEVEAAKLEALRIAREKAEEAATEENKRRESNRNELRKRLEMQAAENEMKKRSNTESFADEFLKIISKQNEEIAEKNQ